MTSSRRVTPVRLALCASLLALAACAGPSIRAPAFDLASLDGSEWPRMTSPTPVDAAMEQRIGAIVAGMTLEQKIGQMTQPDIRYITPDEVAQYAIGSVLNGGGAWPSMKKDASVADWAADARRFHEAAMRADMATPIPLIWGTDAVHGHNNVRGATLFPHNIGLGAAHDPDLLRRIGRARSASGLGG